MLNYDHQNRTRIIFGKDTQKQIGEFIKPVAKKILLHYGGGSIKNIGLYDQIVESLKANGIEFVELAGVKPNPRLSLIREGIELCKAENVELILAVGGGSVIDSSKAIAMGVFFDGDVWDIYEKQAEVAKSLPLMTILTIPAAGSESSTSSVITNDEKDMKLGRKLELTRPLLSIINPEMFFSLPKNQIANGVVDMMCHIFERYFTNTTHTDLTDGMCEAVLKTIIKYGPVVYNDPQNYDAWCQIGFAGNLAHNNLLGLGREEDWACHKMEHELSAIYDVAHGAGLAVVIPGWMRYVYKDNINMFVQFAVNVMGVPGGLRDPEETVAEGIRRLTDFFALFELPKNLRELGIDESNLELMAKKATGEQYGNPFLIGGLKKLNSKDVLEIYNIVK